MSDSVRRLVRAVELGILDTAEAWERAVELTPAERAELRRELNETN